VHTFALPDASGDNQPSEPPTGNRRPVFNLESWRSFFASSRLGVAPLVIHPIALDSLGTKVAITHKVAYILPMSALRSKTKSRIPRQEIPDPTARRLASETGMIADARASVAAGQTCSLEAVTAWVNSWDTDHELPPPHSGC
jgi:hypothetical protein